MIEAEQGKIAGSESTLEFGIVDRKRGDGAGEFLTKRGVGAHQNRERRGVPVMGMNDVGAQILEGGRGCARKEQIAAQIVGIFGTVFGVDAVAAEKSGVIDQIERDAA